MKRLLITLVLALGLNLTLAQQSFPDVPSGHWADDAVSRITQLGIITGFPDGTYRGNEAFTRYQAALVISRTLDVINRNLESAQALSEADMASLRNAIGELAAELDALGARVEAVETGKADQTEVDALNARIDALEANQNNQASADSAEVAALRDQVAALTAELEALRSQIASGALQGPAGPQGPAGADGAPGAPGEVIELPAPEETPVVEEPEAPVIVEPEIVAEPERVEVPAATVGDFSVRLGAMSELSNRFYGRFAVGYDSIIGPIGFRLTADYGRQSALDTGTLGLGGHVTAGFGNAPIRAYVGAGAGYQINLANTADANEGLYVGGIAGVEYLFLGGLGVFVEGGADYYFNAPPAGSTYDNLYPSVGAGFVFRF